MTEKKLLDDKKVLLVDDDPDILETLEDLLPMCDLMTASGFEEGRELLGAVKFDIAVLDIMGVNGYELLKIANTHNVMAVMLTAYAATPADVRKAFDRGAAYYIPKEEMGTIEEFLNDVLDAKAKGKSTWGGWMKKMASFCENKFGQDWKKSDKEIWDKMTFH